MKEMLHRPSAEYGMYFLLFPLGFLAGSFVTSRIGNSAAHEPMVLVGSLLSLAAVVGQAMLLLRGHVTPLTLFGPGFFMSMAQGLSMSYAQAGAMAINPKLAGTAAGMGVFTHNFVGALFAQLYGILADGTPGPLVQATATSAVLGLAAGGLPFLIRRRHSPATKCNNSHTEAHMQNAPPQAQTLPEARGQTVRIDSSQAGSFDCYLVVPEANRAVPAIVLASPVYGVDADICDLADEFAREGFIAAAPNLFWRSLPGPLSPGDKRASERSEPRLERIKTGESDIRDTLAYLSRLPQFNGRAVLMGLCYGGPYAIIAPKRLGYSAGISCHGSQMLDYTHEIEGMRQPICIIWGDKDHRAPVEVLDAYRDAAGRLPNLDLHIFPGIQHSYMMRRIPSAFDSKTRAFSMSRAIAILNTLK